MSDTIKIRYLGKTPKTVDLPIPYLEKSAHAGQVVCDPVGTFPKEDGDRLLAMAGPEGLFILEPFTQEEVGPACGCGCGEIIIIKPQHKYSGIPKYLSGHATRVQIAAIQKAKSEAVVEDHPGQQPEV